jgi:hypothetical protein
MAFTEFARRVRDGNGYLKAILEQPAPGSSERRPLTDEQIRGLYRLYLSEGGWR